MVGKPKNDVPMSSTERSRQYRLRKKQQGAREVNLQFSEDAVKKLDELVATFDLPSRSIAISQLLQVPLDNAIVAMEGFKDGMQDGMDNEALSVREVENSEYLCEVRKLVWSAICSQNKDARDALQGAVSSGAV